MSNRLGLRPRLREHTHGQHVRLNQHPLLVGLTKPGYRIETYGRLLSAYFHLYQTIEAGIDAFLDQADHDLDFDYQRRRKLPWLVTDLQYLGIDPHHPDFTPRQPIELPKIRDTGTWIGTLYPIEGSTLGGQVIAAHLTTTLALTANQGARFFNGYGTSTADHWRHFVTFAESVCGEPACWEAATCAASRLFTSFEIVLDDYHARLNV